MIRAFRSLLLALSLGCPSWAHLAAQRLPPPAFVTIATAEVRPALRGSLLWTGSRLASPRSPSTDWLRSGDRAFEQAPPEVIGALLGAGVGFLAGFAYGVHHDIKHCSWVCGLGPPIFGIYGMGIGVPVGAAGGLLSRLF